MSKAAGKTGNSPTALVAIEQFFPEEKRIVTDSLAIKFLQGSTSAMVRLCRAVFIRDWIVNMSEKSAPGLYGGILCRKRYIDDKLFELITKMDAVVNLGAGLDTRLYRPMFLGKLPAWELDQPENISSKRKCVNQALGLIPDKVILVPVDFDTEDIEQVLCSSGYTFDKVTFFIWEGVTQYLTIDGIQLTFELLSKAMKGSRLAFTYVNRKFIDGDDLFNWSNGYKRFVKTGIWKFGEYPENWSSFLEQFGWKVIEDIDYGQLSDVYIKPLDRNLVRASSLERILFAEKH